ncbi:MAG: helix-turn-helix domain-containing protein [Clostridiales bacterium]|jgi:transcriptional regulator with XRE-family HTH domain|nr:helix-turn-helix domain-containing protein [Clostridiales bacterium]
MFLKNFSKELSYNRILELMKKNNVSHYKLQKDCNLSHSSSSNWKNGATPTTETIFKLADYFNVTADYLLGLSDDPKNTHLD